METGLIGKRSSASGLKSLEYYENKYQNKLTELEQVRILFQIHEMEIASGKHTSILSNCDDENIFNPFFLLYKITGKGIDTAFSFIVKRCHSYVSARWCKINSFISISSGF